MFNSCKVTLGRLHVCVLRVGGGGGKKFPNGFKSFSECLWSLMSKSIPPLTFVNSLAYVSNKTIM